MKLVDLTTVVPDIIVDLRYASVDNITGRILYETAKDWTARLDEPPAKRLAAAADTLRSQGLRLVIWDAYRPSAVQRQLRAVNGDDHYVLEDSNHVKGRAVDVTLARKGGQLLDMGTDHDDFSPRAHAGASDITAEQRANRRLLRTAMERAGFTQWPYEWWHYDFNL